LKLVIIIDFLVMAVVPVATIVGIIMDLDVLVVVVLVKVVI